MALEVIKELEKEIEALKAELKEAKGVADEVKELQEKYANFERKSLFDEDKVTDEKVKEIKDRAVNLKLKAGILGKSIRDLEEYKDLASQIEKAIKPADIDSWIAEKFSKDIIDLMELELKVEKLFPSITVPNQFGRISIPRKTSRTTAYLLAPDTEAIESTIGSDKVTFSPVKLKTLVRLTDEAQNEAVMNSLMQVVKEDIAYSLAKGIETAIVNGDKSGALNNNPSATDVTKAFDGLRKYGDANKVDNGGSAITLANIRSARKSLDALGVDSNEVVLLVNPSVFYQLLDIKEVNTITRDIDKVGLPSGAVASVDGMAVVLSEAIPTNLDANGAVTDDGSLTEALVFNKRAFMVGKRDVVEAEKDRDITKDLDVVVGRVYRDFQKTITGTAVVNIVNIAK